MANERLHKERNNFILRTTFWKCLVPIPKCESAKSRAWRACVLTCLACFSAYVLDVLACFHAYVLACLCASVLACFRTWSAYVFGVLACLESLRAGVPVMMQCFIFLRVRILGVLVLFALYFNTLI